MTTTTLVKQTDQMHGQNTLLGGQHSLKRKVDRWYFYVRVTGDTRQLAHCGSEFFVSLLSANDGYHCHTCKTHPGSFKATIMVYVN